MKNVNKAKNNETRWNNDRVEKVNPTEDGLREFNSFLAAVKEDGLPLLM